MTKAVPAAGRSRPALALWAMLAAVLIFALMDTCLKILSARYPPMQVAALRGLTAMPLVFLYCLWRRALGGLFKVRWGWHLFRAALAIAMLATFSYALQSLPLSETYAIFFVAPLLITAMSAPLLKERVDARRWRAIGVGFLGMLVVLRPGLDGMLTLPALAVLGTAVCYAFSAITVRILIRTDSAESIVFWLTLALGLGAGLLAWSDWVAMRMADLPVLLGLAVTGFTAQMLLTYAFQHGEASAIAPLEYSALAWGAAIDWLVWQVLPDGWAMAGAAVIIASGIYLIRRESQVLDGELP